MSITDGSGLSATDIMALTGNNDGFGNGMGGWWVILFILLLGGGLWGGNGWGGNRGVNPGNVAGDAYVMAGVQQGFDQSAVMTALTNLNTIVSNGFANAAVDSCNKTMTLMQGQNQINSNISQLGYNTMLGMNNGNNDILRQMSTYEMARQNCCCDAKLQLAQTRADMLAEHCSDRNMINQAMNDIETKMNAGFQDLKDQNYQSQIKALENENNNLRMQAYMNGLSASNNAQTQMIIADNQAQTNQIMGFLNPPPMRPFYGWQQNQCPCNA